MGNKELSKLAEILLGFMKKGIKEMLKISAFYLDKQKILFLKNMKCTMYHG